MYTMNDHTGTPIEDADISANETSDSEDQDENESDNFISSSESENVDTWTRNDLKDPKEQDGEEDNDDDYIINKIMKARDKETLKPPDVLTEDFMSDISFSPTVDVIAGGTITGDIVVYKYSLEKTELVATYEVHNKACRAIEYSQSGDLLFTTSADKSIMVTDSFTGQLKQFYDDAHQDPVYSLGVINEHLIATGDENGVVRLWDLRKKSPAFSTKKMEDYVSKILTNGDARYLVCTSGEGTVTSFDIASKCLHIQSELYEAELTCAGLFRRETKLVVGSAKGSLLFYKWGEFGLHTDELPWAKKKAINCLIPISENIAITGWEDGQIRATYLFPHKQLGVVGQHELSVEALDISHDGAFIASSSIDQKLKFWPISFFEDTDFLASYDKKSNQRNLPSSNVIDRSDFFADMA